MSEEAKKPSGPDLAEGIAIADLGDGALVQDLKRSMAFFESIGFSFDPKFTNNDIFRLASSVQYYGAYRS